MERKFIFICILLVTLSVINAIPLQLHKRALVFQKCGGDTLAGLDVTVTPDPLVPGYLSMFEVSGKSVVDDIPEGSVLAIAFLDYNVKDPPGVIYIFNGKVCPVLGCPYPAKTPFTLTAEVLVPAVLPDSYVITVSVLHPTMLEINIGCSFANV